MAFLVVVALLIFGFISVLVGAITSTTSAFVVGALVSGVGIIVLWRQTSSTRERTFVTDAPQGNVPDWDNSIRPDAATPVDDDVDKAVTPVTIYAYDELVAAEILPSLETLSVDELEAVINHERSGLGRLAVINRAQVLIDLTRGDIDPSVIQLQHKTRSSTSRRGPDLSI